MVLKAVTGEGILLLYATSACLTAAAALHGMLLPLPTHYTANTHTPQTFIPHC